MSSVLQWYERGLRTLRYSPLDSLLTCFHFAVVTILVAVFMSRVPRLSLTLRHVADMLKVLE